MLSVAHWFSFSNPPLTATSADYQSVSPGGPNCGPNSNELVHFFYVLISIESDISRCFQRIGVRYHLPSFKTGQMFVGLGMRAHYFDRSYCIEYGTGITF